MAYSLFFLPNPIFLIQTIYSTLRHLALDAYLLLIIPVGSLVLAILAISVYLWVSEFSKRFAHTRESPLIKFEDQFLA